MSKTTEQRRHEEAFRAGVEHTVRRLLELNVVLYGGDGYGSARKVSIDLGKSEDVDTLVFEIIHGTSRAGTATTVL